MAQATDVDRAVFLPKPAASAEPITLLGSLSGIKGLLLIAVQLLLAHRKKR